MEAPKTVDELTAYLLAVASEDVDGDGDPTNEVGYMNPLANGVGSCESAVWRLRPGNAGKRQAS